MTDLYDAAEDGDLERVTLLVEQGVDKNQVGGEYGTTALSAAAGNNHLAVVQFLVEQGADIDKGNTDGAGFNPLHYASSSGHLEVVHYLLEQGADREMTSDFDETPLHWAADEGHLEVTKLLMAYGADLNARNNYGQLPIDIAATEEIRQAIRNEPRRRLDHGHKRATEQDRHPNAAATLASAQQDEVEEDEDEQVNKRPRLDEGAVGGEGKVAEEDEDSEPSDQEDDD